MKKQSRIRVTPREKMAILLGAIVISSAIIMGYGLYKKFHEASPKIPVGGGQIAADAGQNAMKAPPFPATEDNAENVPVNPPPPAEQIAAAARPQTVSPLRFPEHIKAGFLVIIIDDAGNNLNELEPFLRYPGQLTMAVLPNLPNSVEAARRIRAAGKELFLHQPMEAVGGEDPGPGALYVGMTEDQIRQILIANLEELWPVAGINNHQGSKATADSALISVVLEVCKEKNIAFLDSRTTAQTAAPAAAKKLAFPIVARDIFLDNDQKKAAILNAFNDGLAKSAKQDTVIMIGHAKSYELAAVLTENLSEIYAHGYRFSSVAQLFSGLR